jgi:carbamoyltransferase
MFLLAHNTHRMVMRHDSRIGHSWVPNQKARIPHERGGYLVRVNAQGFRSDHNYVGPRGDRPRILFFGDSITAGDGCNNSERFAELVGDELGVDVFNYGLSGSGTDQQLLILEQVVENVDANLIVLGVTVHNIDRIKSIYRPTIDRLSGRRVLVPKPYYSLSASGELELHNVPVPIDRPEEGQVSDGVFAHESHREANPKWRWVYQIADSMRANSRFDRIGRFISPHAIDDHTRLRGFLVRRTGFDPYPDYRDSKSDGCRLMSAIVEKFVALARCPVLIVPIPDQHYFLTGLSPTYQDYFTKLVDKTDGAYIADLTSSLLKLSFDDRLRLYFQGDAHFSPFGNREVAKAIAGEIRDQGLCEIGGDASTKSPRKSSESIYVLGSSCFYHNSGACLIKDGSIVAAAEEERFSRVKADRRFPAHAINYCIEEAEIDISELAAIVYYDNSQLTFERLMHSACIAGTSGLDLWGRMVPSWIQYKLHLPRLIRNILKYDGVVLQNLHHRSHVASAFYPSPFRQAAVLTIDGVGEWATAAIGIGKDGSIQILKEMRFPNSLGLLYSAFTQFTGFRVNDGEYKLMGLAPYGVPKYVDLILEHLVDLKDDGSLELNMEYFAFISEPRMTNERFAELFGGPARDPEGRLTRREMDIARSIQVVTEEALLRMVREAKRLTGERYLCMSGGVALNCVANGRILREGPFEDIWIQPAAGDSGSALGAALDIYHTHFGRPRLCAKDGRSLQQSSLLGPEYGADEIEAFLQTHGYPYHRVASEERAAMIADAIEAGNVVGHFANRTEFGPRALGSRSILGDPRDQETQVTINLKIKYRESFRPFAPVVLVDHINEYFELDRESPYMLLVAPVKEERRLPYDPEDDEDLLKKVRIARSDVPAITHVDYSARVQSIRREDNPAYFDVLRSFYSRTGCAVLVNTSFNVRGEPIVNTPEDAYRCFMRTEMDLLALGDFLLWRSEQPPSQERKGHLDDRFMDPSPFDDHFVAELTDIWRNEFVHVASRLKMDQPELFSLHFGDDASAWIEHATSDTSTLFDFPGAMLEDDAKPASLAAAITSNWMNVELAEAMTPVLCRLLQIGKKYAAQGELDEEVSDAMYVMF